MRYLLFVLLLLLALPGWGVAALPTVPCYGKFEASFTLPNQIGNPFDPDEIDVQAAFRMPSKTVVRVPAFWDGDGWKVRYAPLRLGKYALSILRNGKAVTPLTLSANAFQAIDANDPGFVRRDPAQNQRFMFDDGPTYYPMGMNQAWHSNGLPEYPEMFAKMQAQGLNWARVWMNAWDGKALDWSPDKSQNPKPGVLLLDAARRWDTIVDAAAQNGIYLQMCLQHHGQYTNQTDPNWKDNPANAANGGYLAQPEEFFTDPQARRLARARYRYVVARWGYSPHVMGWELFNEVQNIGEARAHFENVVAWHKEMAAYLRSIDLNHHLVTTSNSNPFDDPALTRIGLDYDQIHAYVPDIVSYFASLDVSAQQTPVFVGEWGPSGGTPLAASFLHDGLWASLMTPTAGLGQFWYWDDVASKNWWGQFGPVTNFVRASFITAQTNLKSVPIQTVHSSARSDLSFAPPDGWGPNKSAEVILAPDGKITGLHGLSSFVQGQYHRDLLPQPMRFRLTCAAPCKFQVSIATAAAAGAHPQIAVDGVVGAEKEYAKAAKDQNVGETLSADVPIGTHTVTLFNTGTDWFTVRKIAVTHYAPALAVLAKGNSRQIVFWAYNRNREGVDPISGTLALPLADGVYNVQLWDTASGKPLGTQTAAKAVNGQARLTLPPFAKDVAGWVVDGGTHPSLRPPLSMPMGRGQ